MVQPARLFHAPSYGGRHPGVTENERQSNQLPQGRRVCGSPAEMATEMVMVGWPPVLNIRPFDEGLQLNSRLRKEFQVEVPLHHVPEEDQDAGDQVTKIPDIIAYARVSHQIYNKREDYLQLRDAIHVGNCAMT
ncbi:hypothetical protein R1sor_024079 [Riccia sorocarpa]|uniref:Uncharacterized protein n=1 Tax=Riccia sorocarpa TaxID=122646 RepID=A0ABD3GPG3_9MARC